MNIAEIVQSSGWKNFMAKLYGIGASVVIVGAMFKIMHWPLASIMIVAGLTTEAIIFFFSAFEPLHEELDWTLVYPELAGMTDPDEMENFKDDMIGNKEDRTLKNFDEIIEKSNINAESFTKLGEGLVKLNKTATKMADIADASVATQEYFNNIKTAAASVNTLNSLYENSGEALKQSVTNLSDSYNKAATVIDKSGAEIDLSYNKFVEKVNSNFNTINSGNESFKSQLETLNKNLAALNTVYELQLKSNNEYLNNSKDIYSGFGKMMKDLEASAEETKKYKDALSGLTNSISSLNSIYGNMLSAMNMVSTK
jgi:gliding motility-associated protein GldL